MLPFRRVFCNDVDTDAIPLRFIICRGSGGFSGYGKMVVGKVAGKEPG